MKVCMQETASVMSAPHGVAAAQFSPASRPRARPAPGRKCVCVWNATGRQKKVIKHVKIKHAKIKHAEARGTKKHAGRTASLDHEQDQHLAGSVCVWNAAGRQKKVIKHAKIKHAEARGTKKHAGRTASLHANDQT